MFKASPLATLSTAALCALMFGVGCTEGLGPLEAGRQTAAVDLRMNHMQAEGTHNSYHIQSWFPLPQYQYTHLELADQAAYQGVRQFELDLHYNPVRRTVDVFHAVVIDRRSTCETLTECLVGAKIWSDNNPGHAPLVFLLETKGQPPSTTDTLLLESIEAQILDAVPEGRIITPDEVQGDHPDLPRALASDGWPSLDDTRGRFLFVLHETGPLRDEYTHGGQDLHGRLMFVESSPGDPFGAFVILNNPVDSAASIHAAVDAGYLVRTRADGELHPSPEQFDAALDSGAHFISSDFPGEESSATGDYWLEIPGGNPSRCNPRVAPAGCTSELIESL